MKEERHKQLLDEQRMTPFTTDQRNAQNPDFANEETEAQKDQSKDAKWEGLGGKEASGEVIAEMKGENWVGEVTTSEKC